MIFVIWALLDHPHHIHVPSIKTRRNLESVTLPAIVHTVVHVAQCQLNEKKAKSKSEMCGTLSVEVVVELAPGPPHPSELG